MVPQCTMMLEGQRTAAAIIRQFKRVEEKKFSSHAFSCTEISLGSYERPMNLWHMRIVEIHFIYFLEVQEGQEDVRFLRYACLLLVDFLAKRVSILQKREVSPDLEFCLYIFTQTTLLPDSWKTGDEVIIIFLVEFLHVNLQKNPRLNSFF